MASPSPITIRGPGIGNLPREVLEAIARCCCPEGSGSGSGGGLVIPCCAEDVFVPFTVSWEITGINCDNAECLAGTGTEDNIHECQAVSEQMPEGWEVFGFFSYAKTCGTVFADIFNQLLIEVCCMRKIDDHTQSQLWVNVLITFSHLLPPNPAAWGQSFRLTSNIWDLGGCHENVLEIINRPLVDAGSTGPGPSSPCNFPNPRISLVFT